MERRICVLPKGVLEEPSGAAVLSLPNPKTGTPHSYMVVSGRVLESVRATDHASWLLEDDTCISDGSIFLWTEVDPLFLLLPFLAKAASSQSESASGSERRVFRSLDDITSALGEQFELSCRRLVELIGQSTTFDVATVCDRRDVCGTVAFSLNQDRLLAWLCCKVESMQKQMYKPRPGDEDNATLRNAVKAYSIGLLSEYIDRSHHQLLLAHYGLDEAAAAKAAAEAVAAAAPIVRDSGPAAPSKAEAAKAQLATSAKSTGVKKLAKVDTKGMKKMESFFTKKPAPPAAAASPPAEEAVE